VGLALCRAVVGAHGGSIRAEATPGGGATLVVRLPLPEGTQRGQATAPLEGGSAGRLSRDGGGADEDKALGCHAH